MFVLGLLLALGTVVPEAGAQAPAQRGVVTGRVTWRGDVPKSRIPNDAGVLLPLLKVDQATSGLSDALVYIVWEKDEPPPRKEAATLEPALMDQQDYAFVPRVLAVRAGQQVGFKNSDLANHNVRTADSLSANTFNIFTGPDSAYRHRFASDSEGRPIRLGCDLHPWMRGWVYVFDHDLFAVTDGRGQFTIREVPPGHYRLVVAQPDITALLSREVEVASGRETKVEVNLPGD